MSDNATFPGSGNGSSGSGQGSSTSGTSSYGGHTYAVPTTGGFGTDYSKGNPYGGGEWNASSSYAGSHHYYSEGPKPSAQDLAAERARTSYGNRLSNYAGDATPAAEEAAATPEPVDTSYVKNDLLNAGPNGEASKKLLDNSGYNFPQQNNLKVPEQVALPNRIALPDNVALPNEIALPNDVALPNEIALPNEVELPERIDFERAMQEADVDVGRVNNIDTVREEALLQQLTEAQRQQAINNADYNVAQNTAQLQRAMQDAQAQFGTQQRQIDIDEQRALDNQALYADARGDRGGIGQAQYNTIQNTAATNRLTVQQEQTQLATDTARQIADLRAQGEFEKANQLLSISQNYLSQLMDLSTWAKEANIGIDEFNLQVAQWEENYKLSLIDAQLDAQASNLNLAQTMMQQEMNRFNAAYQQENSLYNARWGQAQQLWQNAYQQENSLYNARWNQATDLFNAAYNQENSQFEARRNAANDYFNNQLNAANYGLNASKAALEAQINAANATGAFANGMPTYTAQQNARQILAASGQALLEKGIIPTAEQLAAMGMTAEQATQMTGGVGAMTGGVGAMAVGTWQNVPNNVESVAMHR